LDLRNPRAKTFGMGYWALNVAFPKYFQATYKSLLKTTYDVISRDGTIVKKPESGESFFLGMRSLGNEKLWRHDQWWQEFMLVNHILYNSLKMKTLGNETSHSGSLGQVLLKDIQYI